MSQPSHPLSHAPDPQGGIVQRGASLQPNTPQREARSWVGQMCWIWGEGGERGGCGAVRCGGSNRRAANKSLRHPTRGQRARGRVHHWGGYRLESGRVWEGVRLFSPALFHLLLLSSLELLMPHCAVCTTPTLLMKSGFQALCCNPPAPTTPCTHSATRTNAALQCCAHLAELTNHHTSSD